MVPGVLPLWSRSCPAGPQSTMTLRGAMRLEGKVAFISGRARGMGAVEARMLASEGAKVAIGDVLEEEGHRLVEPPLLTYPRNLGWSE